MPDNQMTEIEIMKALFFCKEQGLTSECTGCPYKGEKRDCMEVMLEDAIALLNRKNEEIEEKDAEIEGLEEDLMESNIEIAELYKCKFSAEDVAYNITRARAEAIKAFAERVEKCKHPNPMTMKGTIIYGEDFDQIAKEMGVEL